MKDDLHGIKENVEIDGIRVACTTFDHVLSAMGRAIEQHSINNYICITNTESMYHATRVAEHLTYINNSNFSLCDGIGSVIAGLAFGYKIPRLNGPILMLKACDYGVSRGWRDFFYGGKEGVADLMAEKLSVKNPGLIVAGTYSPPFRQLTLEEENKVIQLIHRSNASIVWVGLGLLKQEKWIAGHLDKIKVPWMIGVGAAFDYHAGTVSWAPKWMQAIGMEWLYRLFLQPRLRIKRYYWSFIFMFQSIYKGFKWRLSRSKS
jgi:N-acetylglucosaminyldiphosphoundecaprenol N-acetyl-beta-D-mannosaminyltransferase